MSNPLHYVITLQWSDARGINNCGTYSDVISPDGRTRMQLYLDILNHAAREYGAPPDRSSVLFFSLEPNEIAA
ncbi:hypothetical protein ACFYY5_29050 [Nocardia elegans]|uniref:Uncharacterized protein n=1 Tax=Nocardia elegans TaxID=300029 RepID=A0ABW6TNY0_9NOCA